MNDIGAFFDTQAKRYDSAYDDPGKGGRILRRRLADAVALLGDGPGDVLDVGMGAGRLCAELVERGWTVMGIDLSPAMVEAARQRLPAIAERLYVGSIDRLPFGDGTFDAVAATGVLEYATDDLDGATRELARVLRPGGRAVVSFPNHASPRHLWRGRVLYPAVRVAKKVVPHNRPAPPERCAPLARLARRGARVRRAPRRRTPTAQPVASRRVAGRSLGAQGCGMSAEPTKVLYIAGVPHSGTTVISQILGQLDGVVSVGELYYLSAALENGDLCGCGELVRECPYWTTVLNAAGVSAETLRSDRYYMAIRELPAVLLRPRAVPSPAYRSALSAVVREAAAAVDARVVVDSSKSPTVGRILDLTLGVDLHVLHVVRSPAASGYSRSRVNPRYGTLTHAVLWDPGTPQSSCSGVAADRAT